MLRDRKIAVFIDVDNTEMGFAQYKSALEQIKNFGEIVCATVYGASERKQKGVIDDAKQRGFSVQLPARTRKRVRKVFDDRIWVDVTDLVAHNANVDTVAIVAYPTDMVYLFSYLRRLGLQVIGCSDLDEASLALVSAAVEVGGLDADDFSEELASAKHALKSGSDAAAKVAVTEAQSGGQAANENVVSAESDKHDIAADDFAGVGQVAQSAVSKNSGEQSSENIESQHAFEWDSSEEAESAPTADPNEHDSEKSSDWDSFAKLRETENAASEQFDSPKTAALKQQPPAKDASFSAETVQGFSATATTGKNSDSPNAADLVTKVEEAGKKHRTFDTDDELVAEIQRLLDGLD